MMDFGVLFFRLQFTELHGSIDFYERARCVEPCQEANRSVKFTVRPPAVITGKEACKSSGEFTLATPAIDCLRGSRLKDNLADVRPYLQREARKGIDRAHLWNQWREYDSHKHMKRGCRFTWTEAESETTEGYFI